MGLVTIPPGEQPLLVKLKAALASLTAGQVSASIAIMADAGLIALTAWVTAFVAGAPITKETVYTGAVTVMFAVHIVGGLLAVLLSTIATITARRTLTKGEPLRKQVGNWWVCAHLFFVLAIAANSIYVEIKL